ncbi:MAG: hypothetical protein VX738_03070 [Planctomycetota bacterium]|nr:hypothetical protein [Planctomycetota bacterium]
MWPYALSFCHSQTRLFLHILIIITFTGIPCIVGCTDNIEPPPPELTTQQIIENAIHDSNQTSILIDSTVVKNDDLRVLDGYSHITSLLFDNSQITDEGLSHLTNMPGLTQLRIRSTLSDSAVDSILEMEQLQYLNLPFADFTDAGIQALSQHPEIKLLRIGGPHLTDDAVKHIAKMPSLLFLHLIRVPITDAALPELYTNTNLQSLYLDDSLTTEKGLLKLIEHLPQLHLHINQGHLDRDPSKHPH